MQYITVYKINVLFCVAFPWRTWGKITEEGLWFCVCDLCSIFECKV